MRFAYQKKKKKEKEKKKKGKKVRLEPVHLDQKNRKKYFFKPLHHNNPTKIINVLFFFSISHLGTDGQTDRQTDRRNKVLIDSVLVNQQNN